MAIIKDSQGNEINNLVQLGGETIIDTRNNIQVINTLNGEVTIDCKLTESAIVDIRGTFTATFIIEATVNGTDYFQLPIFNIINELQLAGITTVGTYFIQLPAATKRIRVRCSAYASGSANIFLRANNGTNILYAKPLPTTITGTLLTTANTAGTLTLSAPGVGLFHYITRVEITRVNGTATAVTGTAALSITTTNLTGSPAWTTGNAIAAGDSKLDVILGLSGNPLKSTTANTATTFVLPAAGAGVQYRINVSYYIGM